MSQERLQTPKLLPQLNIPRGDCTVLVKIIDSTSHISGLPLTSFLQPAIKGHEFLSCPAFSFLVAHPSGRKVVFDLGVRKDWNHSAPRIVNRIKDGGWSVKVEKNVGEILEEHGTEEAKLSDRMCDCSHWHWDHTGDPSVFPTSTSLLVGPGFKEALLPGYPKNQEASIKESDYADRTLREIDFSKEGKGLKIGCFRAMDYFGDGSFYLLDSPGHAVGHMCGLARTTSDTFILMGGDACHHGGEFRPTEYLPLPKHISPNPLDFKRPMSCPGALFEAIHPKKSATEPFYEIADLGGKGVAHDADEAKASVRKMEEFDADENVFVVIAHDETLLDVVDFFPKKANAWKEKGWAVDGKWRFLKDFKEAVEEVEQN
ncbi:MAG: hypothetical protein M1827_005805 [Pycnora praestabilis]|nr:MAG: hypothetical protein M1827_005805 [Pycnora praestabilis]